MLSKSFCLILALSPVCWGQRPVRILGGPIAEFVGRAYQALKTAPDLPDSAVSVVDGRGTILWMNAMAYPNHRIMVDTSLVRAVANTRSICGKLDTRQ